MEKLPAHGTWGKGYQKDLFLPPARRFPDPGPLLFFQAVPAPALFPAALLPGTVRRPAGGAGLPFLPQALALAQPGLFRHPGLHPDRPGLFLLVPRLPGGPGHAAGPGRPVPAVLQVPRATTAAASGPACCWAAPFSGGSSTPFSSIRSAWASSPIGCGKESSGRRCCCSSFRCFSRPCSFITCTTPTAAFLPTPSITACSVPRRRRTLVRDHPEQDHAEHALGDPARLFLRPARRPAALQSLLLFRLPRPAAGPEKFQALPPAPAGALPALLFVLNHAFSTIRAGYCPQGRYLAPVAWALLLFAVIYYRESRNRFFKKAFLVLPLYPLFVAAYQVVEPFTLYQPTTHDSLLRAGPDVPELEQQPHRPARPAPLLHQDRQPRLPAQRRVPGWSSCCWSRSPWSLCARGTGAAHGGRSRSLFSWAFSPWPAFSPGSDMAAPRQLTGPRDLPVPGLFHPAARRQRTNRHLARFDPRLPPAHRDPGPAQVASRSACENRSARGAAERWPSPSSMTGRRTAPCRQGLRTAYAWTAPVSGKSTAATATSSTCKPRTVRRQPRRPGCWGSTALSAARRRRPRICYNGISKHRGRSMIFSTPAFLFLFLPPVLLVGLFLKRKAQNVFLLLASLIFYAWGEGRIRAAAPGARRCSTISSAWRSAPPPRRGKESSLLAAGLGFNLALLVAFKYAVFIAGQPGAAARRRPRRQERPLAPAPGHLLLHLHGHGLPGRGLQSRHPGRDATRCTRPCTSPFSRPCSPARSTAIPAWDGSWPSGRPAPELLAHGVRRFIIGLGKKVLLADTLARAVDAIFAIPAAGPDGRRWPGWEPSATRCRSSWIFRDIPTWPSAWAGCSASPSWKISITPISPGRSPNSGPAGTFPSPPGCAISFSCPWPTPSRAASRPTAGWASAPIPGAITRPCF